MPLIISGCFLNKQEDDQLKETEISYEIYRSELFEKFSFTARYLNNNLVEETSTGNLEGFNDKVSFSNLEETTKVEIFYQTTADEVLKDYNIESQSQTEVFASLATSLFGTTNDNNRFEGAIIETGEFIILVTNSKPGSAEFAKFISDFSFAKFDSTKKGQNITVKLYFDSASLENFNCEATAVKTATIRRPSEDLGLIPEIIKLLIQLSVPEDLEQENLLTAIPINTRIRSFGYEDNKAIVNFNADLNEGGGSCLMEMRRSQIAKTLMSLNEVTDLEIKEVEIQVEGDSQSALQP